MIISGFPVVFACFVKATPEVRKRSLLQWVELARVRNHSFMPEGTWGVLLPMDSYQAEWSIANLNVDCCLQDYGDYLCFQMFALWDDVSDYGLPPYGEMIRDATLEEQEQIVREEPSFYKDPRVHIAEEFAGVCVAVGAEVGVYTKTWLYKPTCSEMQAWLKEFVYEPGVRVRDARALFDTRWRVLFLNKEWDKELHRAYPDAYVDEQMYFEDENLVGRGVLLFKNSGRYRF